MKKINLKPIIAGILVILILNIFFLKTSILGAIFGILYLIYFSSQLGKRIFYQEENNHLRFLMGFIFLLALLILGGTILYYVSGLFNWTVSLVLLTPLFFTNHYLFKTQTNQRPTTNPNDASPRPIKQSNFIKLSNYQIINILLAILYSIFTCAAFFILFTHRTTGAVVSPWQAAPSYFFIIYFVASALLLLKILKFSHKNNLIFIIFHSLLTSSVVLIIYQIGFGFDPFVHRATEKIIINQGFILPKTPYYIGQYSLVIILTKLLNINLALVDKLLVPLIGCLTIPTLIYFIFSRFGLKQKIIQILALTASYLILFTVFFTVPQHLANLFLIIFIFILFLKNQQKNIPFNYLWLLALTIAAIHPLAGFSALLACWLLSLQLIKKIKIRKILISLFTSLAVIGVPLLFLIASKTLPSFQLSFSFLALNKLFKQITQINFYLPFYSFLHSLYLLKLYFIPFVLFLSITGFYAFYKKHPVNTNKIIIFPVISLILLFNALFLQFINFKSIIYYEQKIFAARLVHTAYFFALPFILYEIYLILYRTTKTKNGQLMTLIILSFIFTSCLYLTYPRYDILEKNKGFAVSSADIKAVKLIEKEGSHKNYVVLANQSTSAAALKEFGFKKYFKTANQALFYYPIPTSSPLYQIYLDITYQGIKNEFINQAKRVTDTDTVFLVITDYWTNHKKLIKQGKQTAHHGFEIDHGKIWVFEY